MDTISLFGALHLSLEGADTLLGSRTNGGHSCRPSPPSRRACRHHHAMQQAARSEPRGALLSLHRCSPSSRTPGGPEHNTITGTTVRTRGFDLKKRTFGVTLTTGGPLISKISLFKTVGGRMHLSCTSLASNLGGGMAGRRTPSSSPSCQIGSRRLSAVLFLDHAREG